MVIQAKADTANGLSVSFDVSCFADTCPSCGTAIETHSVHFCGDPRLAVLHPSLALKQSNGDYLVVRNVYSPFLTYTSFLGL